MPDARDTWTTHVVDLHREGKHTGAEVAELFEGGRSTVYRAVEPTGASEQATPWIDYGCWERRSVVR